jgi:hypothetical protein
VLIDTYVLEAENFVLHGRQLTVADRTVPLEPSTRGWIRRLAPPHWRRGLTSGSRESAVRSAWLRLVVTIAEDADIGWLSRYQQLVATESKLLQARHARRLGITVPATVIAKRLADIPAAFGNRLVVKPLGAGHFTQPDGEAMVVLARELDRSDPRFEALGGAPFIVQQAVRARRHLRVVTVGDQVWVCGLDASGLPLDWRDSAEAHHAFQPVDVSGVRREALALAEALQVGYSSQDWIDTGHEVVFVDLNPAGQWLFLPDPVRGQVAAAIAAFLSGR